MIAGVIPLEHLDALFRFTVALTGNRVEPEDLIQETSRRATGAGGWLWPGLNLKAWRFAITCNIQLNQLRAVGARPG